jgi:hypothetical protein
MNLFRLAGDMAHLFSLVVRTPGRSAERRPHRACGLPLVV